MIVFAECLMVSDEMAIDLVSRLRAGTYAPVELALHVTCRTKADRVFVSCPIAEWAHMLSKLEGAGFRVIGSSFGEVEAEEVPFEAWVQILRAESAGVPIDEYFAGVAARAEQQEGGGS